MDKPYCPYCNKLFSNIQEYSGHNSICILYGDCETCKQFALEVQNTKCCPKYSQKWHSQNG